ncbi:MAG TPA: tetratricopeptide repeat protein [Terriglobales bacterium]|nr:tetratricopeptide repeat protein [Terriglobales bacterium]
MKTKCLFLAVCILLACCPLLADEGHHHEMTAEQVGSVSFPTSCAPAVQKDFEHGVAWLHSFEYEQAGKQFAAVAQADPKCAMAYWGEAMSLYHQLWSRPDANDVKQAAAWLAQAKQLNAKTQRERDYIAALTLFYASDDPAGYNARVAAYSDAMDKLRQADPQDREAAVFYALSLLASSDGNDPALTKERKAVGILNEQLKGAPTHPGITHYIIHATDNPQLAALGLDAARAYAKIAPASTHAVHMPSHIFARLGLWQDDIQSNLAALAVADKMTGYHMAHHRIHSMEFLEYAYLQIGDDRDAKAQVDALLAIPKSAIDPAYMEAYQDRLVTFPSTYALERKQWKDALAVQADPSAPPYVQAGASWTHAIAAGHLKDAAAAKAAVDQYLALIEATKKSRNAYLARYMDMGRDEAIAWLRHAEGNDDEAVRLLRAVADKQDKVGKGEVELPAREMLGDLLLEAGRPAEALAEYETALKTDPNRFNGLYGAARAAEEAKQTQKAAEYYAQLVKNCSGSASERPELARAKSLATAGE